MRLHEGRSTAAPVVRPQGRLGATSDLRTWIPTLGSSSNVSQQAQTIHMAPLRSGIAAHWR